MNSRSEKTNSFASRSERWNTEMKGLASSPVQEVSNYLSFELVKKANWNIFLHLDDEQVQIQFFLLAKGETHLQIIRCFIPSIDSII